MDPARVFSLNVHASYACRHSGACCTAGWTIPVEPHLRSLLGAERLLPEPDGACPEYDRRSGLCRIHRDYGESTLPASCHHFPRRALLDDRGTFVTLSHFCPTAAALLVDFEGPLAVVADPPAFPAERGYEGMDARGEWPPLLRPHVMFDAESFGMWERFLVETVSNSADDVDPTLARVATIGERLRGWSPDQGTLTAWTADALAASPPASSQTPLRYAPFDGPDAFVRAAATIPQGLERPTLPSHLAEADAQFVATNWNAWTPVVLRYVGARAFASWTAYQSRGVRTQIAELFVTAAVLRVECARACQARQSTLDRRILLDAIRASDLLLVHLASRDALMAWLGEVEDHALTHTQR
jgi:hypothetical protein